MKLDSMVDSVITKFVVNGFMRKKIYLITFFPLIKILRWNITNNSPPIINHVSKCLVPCLSWRQFFDAKYKC